MDRRMFMGAGIAAAATASAIPTSVFAAFEVTRTDAEWRSLLTRAEYKVMRNEGTERAFSSPLDKNYAAGIYHCKGCDLAVYSSEHKYDSGTGWPSFWQALPGTVGTKPDRKLLRLRTEVHCRRCGSHLGHIFDDGPQPTGKRHCLNGISLVFKSA